MTHLSQLCRRVADTRAQLAELETEYTREKSHVDVMQAGLFRQLRGHYQKRDRLRLAVEYRQKFLDSFIRDDTDEVEQAEKDFEQAKAQLDEDYEELAAAADKKKPLTAGQEAGLAQSWKKLVKLYHPARFANEPEKLETCHQLIAAINQAKDAGDIELLREIAEDPHGFLIRQGWMNLDFTDVEEVAQFKQLHETLQTKVTDIAESLKGLRATSDYELYRLAGQKPGGLDELAAERAQQLEIEIVELEKQAEALALKIKNLSDEDDA
jgi:hypothetical protein